MKFKIIIIRKRKAERTIFRFLTIVTALLLAISSFAPVKFEKILVKNPPINWQEMTEKDDEIVIQDYFIPIIEKKKVVATAYSSTADQCDSTPFITASGTRVRDGIIACNFLEFGTRVLIPEEFGFNKVFTVEDKMAKKHNDKVDIWHETRKDAKKFGIKELEIIVLED